MAMWYRRLAHRRLGRRPLSTTASRGQSPARLAYIALGSNVGDRVAMIERACCEMDRRDIRVRRTSCLWETEPMYYLDQGMFVNGACEVETTLEPLELLDELKEIERIMGRTTLIDKGPRNIDLDIMLYDDRVINHDRLIVPHAGLLEREFMLRPLAELIPNKPIDLSLPTKHTIDYLADVSTNNSPMLTLTPLAPGLPTLSPLKPDRRTQVMAILNLTPDSFSDGGALKTPVALREAALRAIRAGAAVIDVGGQSTRPGAQDVGEEEELARVLPAVQLIRSLPEAYGTAISVDTYRAGVARAVATAGADVINDVSGGQLDADMLSTMAQLGKTVVLMHMRGTPATMTRLAQYPDPGSQDSDGLVAGIASELLERVRQAEAAGARRWRLVLDPGLGFAKAGAQNSTVLRRLAELRDWPGLRGLPWLVGPSRKAFIGTVTGQPRPQDRVWGTAAAVAAAVHGGADLVRVHDVAEMAQVVQMADAIWRRRA